MTDKPVAAALGALAHAGQRLPSRHRLTRDDVAESQRGRLMYGMLQAAADNGFRAVRIQDVVERAGVSRQAFYLHFANLDTCFAAAFDRGFEVAIGEIETAVRAVPRTHWPEIIRAGTRAYLAVLAAEPAAAWAMHIEALAAGPVLAKRTTEALVRIATLFQLTHHAARLENAALPEPDIDHLTLVVGGMAERIRNCLYTHGAAALPDLEPLLVTAMFAAFGVPPPHQPDSDQHQHDTRAGENAIL